jgi:hypothetical protein
MDGTDPSTSRPGVKLGASIGDVPSPENGVSMPKLLALPDVAECTLCPAELCLPSDFCEYVRSIMGCELSALPDRGISSTEERCPCDQWL